MFESTTGAFERQYYTIDLTGLAAHARDTFAAYMARFPVQLRDPRVKRGESDVGPAGRHHADYHVPDSVRVR